MNIPVLINPRCEHLRRPEETITAVNREQKFFRLSLVPARWLPDDENEEKEVTAEHIRVLVEKNFQKVPEDKPAIAVIQNPFDDNSFSQDYCYLSIITIASCESSFAPHPVRIYLVSQFA